MKKVAQIVEVEGEGFEALLEETVVLFCLNYIYTGKLVGVNESFVKLENPGIVYETGDFQTTVKAGAFKDVQWLPVKEFYIQRSAVESFGKQR